MLVGDNEFKLINCLTDIIVKKYFNDILTDKYCVAPSSWYLRNIDASSEEAKNAYGVVFLARDSRQIIVINDFVLKYGTLLQLITVILHECVHMDLWLKGLPNDHDDKEFIDVHTRLGLNFIYSPSLEICIGEAGFTVLWKCDKCGEDFPCNLSTSLLKANKIPYSTCCNSTSNFVSRCLKLTGTNKELYPSSVIEILDEFINCDLAKILFTNFSVLKESILNWQLSDRSSKPPFPEICVSSVNLNELKFYEGYLGFYTLKHNNGVEL